MSVMPEPSNVVHTGENGSGLAAGKGPLRCGSCGYEIVSYRGLPACPMCREIRWEQAPWRPFTRQAV
jgi:hypothetical protein